MNDSLKRAAQLLVDRPPTVALTGAGISVDSGIPDFRSSDGLWARFDPMKHATIQAFEREPERVWEMVRAIDEVLYNAAPNPGHHSLAELEQMGLLESVVTQNIDGLHQKAGSKRVIDFHGNSTRLTCLNGCGGVATETLRPQIEEGGLPHCERCGRIMKPDVVLFGEPIPEGALYAASHCTRYCGVLLVVGTSATVAPASGLPLMAKKLGAQIIEINTEPTPITPHTHLSLFGSSSEILPQLVETAKLQIGSPSR